MSRLKSKLCFLDQERVMGDLKNTHLIVAKGFLFFCLGCFACLLLLCLTPRYDITVLLAISIWAFCRFYYFAFYVIEHYVDPEFKFSGLASFLMYFMSRNSKINCEDVKPHASMND